MLSILAPCLCSNSCEETTAQPQLLSPSPATARGTKLEHKKVFNSVIRKS